MRTCKFGVETFIFKQVWCVIKNYKVVHAGDASIAAVALQPDVQLPQWLDLMSPKQGGGSGPEMMYCLFLCITTLMRWKKSSSSFSDCCNLR